MGLAVDTISTFVANPGAAGAAVTVATGDSLTVRNFASTDFAKLTRIIRVGATEGFVQVLSPLLHDDVRGVRFQTAESPSILVFPMDVGQPLEPSDTLAVTVSGGTAETDQAVLQVYYSNVLGTAARLHMWGDISGNIKNIKILDTVCNASGTQGQWTDTVITTTEDLLHVNSDYAVLGTICDQSLAAIGIKGQETGNLRVCTVGTTTTDDTSDAFIKESQRLGVPYIPVISPLNKGSIFASVVNDGSHASVHVQLVLAELVSRLSS